MKLYILQGSSEKRLTGNGEKLNTSQAEPVAASSWAVGQFLSFSCEAFILLTWYMYFVPFCGRSKIQLLDVNEKAQNCSY